MMRKINKLLKKGGEIIVGVPNDAVLHYINPVKYFEHERHYSNEMIKTRLQNTGFKIIHFNLVETWTMLLNLYIHIFLKFVLRVQTPFGVFRKRADETYRQFNRWGMDIQIKAIKI